MIGSGVSGVFVRVVLRCGLVGCVIIGCVIFKVGFFIFLDSL